MSDQRRRDDVAAVVTAGAEADDQAVERLLEPIAARQRPDADFRRRLGETLRAAAGDAAVAPAAARAATAAGAAVGRWRLNRRRQLVAAGMAFAAAAAAVWLVLARGGLGGGLPPLPAASRTLPADAPVRLRAPEGRRVVVALASATPVAVIELRDGAEIAFRPAGAGEGQAPSLDLARGFARVVAGTPLVVQAGREQLALSAGADVAVELVRSSQERGETMRIPNVWVVPASAVAGAAITVGFLVLDGRVAFSKAPARGPAVPPAGEVMVLQGDDAGGGEGAARAQRRDRELTQKVAALRQENARLATQLARKKGVTVANVLERIGALKGSQFAAMISPGAMGDLLMDLKGLGDEGTQAMIKLLETGDSKERFLAANLLEQLNQPAAIPALRKAALEDADPLAAKMSSHALALMDDAATVPALREIAAANKTWESQVNALWGLCKHGDQKAIAQTLALMKDEKSSPQVRAALGGNLMLLPDPELMPIVDETMRQFGKVEQLGALAVEYYKNTGTPEGRARLEAMAKDAKLPEAVRKAAQAALAGGSGGGR
jgi:hypothetical protein